MVAPPRIIRRDARNRSALRRSLLLKFEIVSGIRVQLGYDRLAVRSRASTPIGIVGFGGPMTGRGNDRERDVVAAGRFRVMIEPAGQSRRDRRPCRTRGCVLGDCRAKACHCSSSAKALISPSVARSKRPAPVRSSAAVRQSRGLPTEPSESVSPPTSSGLLGRGHSTSPPSVTRNTPPSPIWPISSTSPTTRAAISVVP